MNQLQNILELSWHVAYNLPKAECPNCGRITDMDLEITQKHVRLDCISCHKVFFYRRVSLGAVE